MSKTLIHIVAPKECGWCARIIRHCCLLKNVRYTVENWELKHTDTVDKNRIDFSKRFPQVFVDGKYIGGYYELVERFPL